MAILLEMSIKDRAGLAIAYDQLSHRGVKNVATKRPDTADYFDFPSSVSGEIRTGVVGDVDHHSEVIRRRREREKGRKEKKRREKRTIDTDKPRERGAG